MRDWILGALKALTAGLIAGAGTLLLYLGADPALVAILGVIFGPLAVYAVPNVTGPAIITGRGALTPEQVAPPPPPSGARS